MPPTDPRFLDATYEEMVADLIVHRRAENPNDEFLETEDFEAEVRQFMAGDADDEGWDDA